MENSFISPDSLTSEINPTAGGAIKMKSVGNSLSGKGLWKIIRLKNITNNVIQKNKPILKKNQDISEEKWLTPATGTRILPTAGINQAGFICLISNFVCWIQIEIILIVKIKWIIVPESHKYFEVSISTDKNAILNKSKLIENVGKKLNLTGWSNSFFTSLIKTIIFIK